MSEVIDPPEYYFTGVNFNPAFYNQDAGTGITEATANGLYLRKTVPDTATSVETFAGGIITNTLTAQGTGSLDIVIPATSATNVLNVGTVSRTILGQVHHYSDGDNCIAGAGVHINNGINNNSATNIHNGTGANLSGQVNIMSGTSNSGAINMGTASTTTTINGITKASQIQGLTPTSTMYVGNNLTTTGSLNLGNTGIRTKNQGIFETASIRAPATNGTVAICGDATTGGGVDIGSANGTVNLLASSIGGVNVPTSNGTSTQAVNVGYLGSALAPYAQINQANTWTQTQTFNNATAGINANIIQGIATTGTQSLFTTKTSGDLTCLAVGTAVLNVKGSGIKFDTLTTDNSTGTQGLYTNKTAGTLSIATAQTSGNINIGGVGSTTTIKGTGQVDTGLTVTGTGILTNTITSSTGSTLMKIASNARTFGGNIELGNDGLTGGPTGADFTGIKIGAGSNGIRSFIDLGSASMENTYFRSKTIAINDNGSGNTTIGTNGGTGTITMYRPITPSYLPSTITSSQIGYKVEDTINITTLTSGNQFSFTTGVTLPAGVWLITASFRISGSSSVITDQNYGINIVGSSPTITYGQYLLTGSITASGISYTGTGVVVSDGTTAYNIQLYIIYSGGSLSVSPSSNSSGSNVKRTRIA